MVSSRHAATFAAGHLASSRRRVLIAAAVVAALLMSSVAPLVLAQLAEAPAPAAVADGCVGEASLEAMVHVTPNPPTAPVRLRATLLGVACAPTVVAVLGDVSTGAALTIAGLPFVPVALVAWVDDVENDLLDDAEPSAAIASWAIEDGVAHLFIDAPVVVGGDVPGGGDAPCEPVGDAGCLTVGELPCEPTTEDPCPTPVEEPCEPTADLPCPPIGDEPCEPTADLPCPPSGEAPCEPTASKMLTMSMSLPSNFPGLMVPP